MSYLEFMRGPVGYRSLEDCAKDCRALKEKYGPKDSRWTFGKFACLVTSVKNQKETCCLHKRNDGLLECCSCHTLRLNSLTVNDELARQLEEELGI